MSDEKKKESKNSGINGHVFNIGISLATGYFVLHVEINDLFSWPSYFYVAIFIFIGILLLSTLFSFIRFFIVNHRDSKQKEYFSMPFFIDDEPSTSYRSIWRKYEGLMWKVQFLQGRNELNDIHGPYCPKDDCGTELNARKTYLGRYKYKCPACSFERTSDYNSYTLESNFEKVTKAKFKKVREEKVRKEQEAMREVGKRIRKAWDEV